MTARTFWLRARPLLPAWARPCLSLALALLIAAPGASLAAGSSLGLDLSSAPPDDFKQGPRVVAVPPRKADGRADLESYRPIHAALREKLGARLAGVNETVKALRDENLQSAALLTAGCLARLGAAVKAERAIVFDVIGKRIQGRVYETFDTAAVGTVAMEKPRRMDLARARPFVAELLVAGRRALLPPAPEPEPPPVVAQEGVGDVTEEARREEGGGVTAVGRAEAGPGRPIEAPRLVVLVGGGTTLRFLKARTSLQVVPRAQGALPGMGVDLSIYPFRMAPGLRTSWIADFALEGYYRRTFAGASVSGGPSDGEVCKVDDDEVFARASYRYPLPGRYSPRLGLSYAWTSERALMRCATATALSTRYVTNELHLRILQPLVGEQLQLEVSGGPRFLLSKRAAGYADRSFSIELWLTGRPHENFYLRGGARYTNTSLQSYPLGVPLRDQRTFIGAEVGASI